MTLTDALARLSLIKAKPRPPAGFIPIPDSKHGGFHKQVGSRWVTWYPDIGRERHPTERFTNEEHAAMKKPEPSKKMTWKRDPREVGLRAIGEDNDTRGASLMLNGEEMAHVSSIIGRHGAIGWFWTTSPNFDGPFHNSHQTPAKTLDEAKKQAMDHVKPKG